MQIQYKAKDNTTFTIEVDNVREAFQFIAYCDTIFGVDQCGNCGCPDLVLSHRTAQEFDFYAVQCTKCHHELKFGQTRVGNKLYPKGWHEPYNGGESQDGGDENTNQDQEQSSKPAGKPKDKIAF